MLSPSSVLIDARAISLFEYLTKPHPSNNMEKYYFLSTASN